MNAARVREHAEAHAKAMVDGDLRRAGSDLTPEAQQAAGAVMKEMPEPVRGAAVEEVALDGDSAVARIVYTGAGTRVLVESRWEERDGRPMIVSLSVL